MTLSVQVAVGASAYGLPLGVNADFARLNKRGTFSFVLPASTRGKTVRLWQSFQQLFPERPDGAGRADRARRLADGPAPGGTSRSRGLEAALLDTRRRRQDGRGAPAQRHPASGPAPPRLGEEDPAKVVLLAEEKRSK